MTGDLHMHGCVCRALSQRLSQDVNHMCAVSGVRSPGHFLTLVLQPPSPRSLILVMQCNVIIVRDNAPMVT
jgi:hypothetical protein